jgi:hypothetical protein
MFFLLFPEDDDFAILFWSASSDRPCILRSRKKLPYIQKICKNYQRLQIHCRSKNSEHKSSNQLNNDLAGF